MKVSVHMLAYNHEKYIAQAIESVLMQNVKFDYEIVIGDDCSTDATREIIEGFRVRYPEKIRLVTSATNVGMFKNSQRVFEACKGEYIAILEGDDYWTSADKLQKQVDFLDTHPECVTCFHNVAVVTGDDCRVIQNYCTPDQKEISTFEDLLVTNFIPSCSVLCRANLIGALPDWFFTLEMGDWPFHLLNAQRGAIGYLAEVMGAYRVHQNGVWSGMSQAKRFQANLITLETIKTHLDIARKDILQASLDKNWGELMILFVGRGVEIGTQEGTAANIEALFDRWPAKLVLPEAWKSEVLGKVYGKLVFQAYDEGDAARVRCWLPKLIRYDRSWLWNRGIWSIGIRAFCGLTWKHADTPT
jgi:glycosyltransferase involved in cell wall biosynthesis